MKTISEDANTLESPITFLSIESLNFEIMNLCIQGFIKQIGKK